MSILQLRLTFQLTIDHDKHLKYSHSDCFHLFVNDHPRIGFSHTIENDIAAEYLNNAAVHFLYQLKEGNVNLLIQQKILRLLNNCHYIKIQLYC
jgi:peptidase E